MLRTLRPYRHTLVVCHSQNAALSSMVLSAVPHHLVPRPGTEHCDQLFDDHDLAGLRWREHDDLLQPDGGTLCTKLLAGATGLAVGVAFIRGLARQGSDTLGNFWVDLTRALLWVLLPGALLGAVLLVWQGVPMNFHHYAVVRTVEGTKQVIPQGPVAALEIIKNLGTSGGGFFNANGAHPYENPTPLTNFLETLAIVLVPAAFTNTFGRMVGQPRQGWIRYGVMLLLFVCGLVFVHNFEQRGFPDIRNVDARRRHLRSGGNMEGKEVRFGIGSSSLTAVVTSNTATGSNNSLDDRWHGFAGKPAAGRTRIRRTRDRPLQHGHGRCDRGVSRRTNGWAHA